MDLNFTKQAVRQGGEKPLTALKPGEAGVVKRLSTSDEASLKLMELGFGPGEVVTFLRATPLGGPIEVELMGYRLCIRRAEGDRIFVDPHP
jgi:Fe2+ transport system protein FeoA